jgi:hypothetical protein
MSSTAYPFVDRRKSRAKRKLYKVASFGLIDADFNGVVRRIIQLEIIGFAAVIGVVWIDEIWGLPHLIYGGPESNHNLHEATFETGWICLVLAFVLVITKLLLKQIRYLEGFLPVCSYCKSIRNNENWTPLEQFLHERSNVKLTHSLCPTCAKKHYGYED